MIVCEMTISGYYAGCGSTGNRCYGLEGITIRMNDDGNEIGNKQRLDKEKIELCSIARFATRTRSLRRNFLYYKDRNKLGIR